MSSLDAAVDKPFTLGNYLSILLELVTSKRLLVAFFPSLRFIWDIFIQVNLNHSLPEMMYSWWLQVVRSVATLLHSWIWCFNLVLAHREYPSDSYCIYYECLLILSWVSSGYVSGWWGVLFDPKVSLHRAKKDTSFEIFTFVDFTHFKRDLGSRLHDFFLRISCVRLMNFFQTLTRKRQSLMQSLCSFIPFRKKAWLLKRIWSFQNSIRTA